MSESTMRKRPKGSATPDAKSALKPKSPDLEIENSPGISVLDILRIIVTLCLASFALSYYITSGESFLWGYRPWVTRPGLLKAYFKGPLKLTPAQLSLYNGTDSTLPIYLAINGTIFDVSVGAHTYGPGGSYHVFAGRDATRAFVTGCFHEDTTSDLRGAEEMYLPIDDEDEQISSRDRKVRAEREKREAKKRVQQEVEKWVKFYGNSKKYFEVGKLARSEVKDGPAPPLCDSAAKSRLRRKSGSESEAEGKPV